MKTPPEIVHVAEEDEKRRKNHADADVEDEHSHDRIEKKDKSPSKSNVIKCAEEEENQQGQPEID